jgi:hypothetical protein
MVDVNFFEMTDKSLREHLIQHYTETDVVETCRKLRQDHVLPTREELADLLKSKILPDSQLITLFWIVTCDWSSLKCFEVMLWAHDYLHIKFPWSRFDLQGDRLVWCLKLHDQTQRLLHLPILIQVDDSFRPVEDFGFSSETFYNDLKLKDLPIRLGIHGYLQGHADFILSGSYMTQLLQKAMGGLTFEAADIDIFINVRSHNNVIFIMDLLRNEVKLHRLGKSVLEDAINKYQYIFVNVPCVDDIFHTFDLSVTKIYLNLKTGKVYAKPSTIYDNLIQNINFGQPGVNKMRYLKYINRGFKIHDMFKILPYEHRPNVSGLFEPFSPWDMTSKYDHYNDQLRPYPNYASFRVSLVSVSMCRPLGRKPHKTVEMFNTPDLRRFTEDKLLVKDGCVKICCDNFSNNLGFFDEESRASEAGRYKIGNLFEIYVEKRTDVCGFCITRGKYISVYNK